MSRRSNRFLKEILEVIMTISGALALTIGGILLLRLLGFF